jgi:hypothetical protein
MLQATPERMIMGLTAVRHCPRASDARPCFSSVYCNRAEAKHSGFPVASLKTMGSQIIKVIPFSSLQHCTQIQMSITPLSMLLPSLWNLVSPARRKTHDSAVCPTDRTPARDDNLRVTAGTGLRYHDSPAQESMPVRDNYWLIRALLQVQAQL